MPYSARVFRILIASPSDVFQERNIIDRVRLFFFYRYSKQKKIVLLPTRWENQVPPTLNSSPQDIINSRIVEDCDLAVGVFWTRIGSPTEHYEGGTVEELDKVGRANKIVMIYFSDVPISPSKIDVNQSTKLDDFKHKTYPKGIVHNYNDLADFERAFTYHLDMHINDLIELDKEENPSPNIDKQNVNKYQQYNNATNDYIYLLTHLKKHNPKIDPSKSTNKQILEKINSTLDYLHKHKKWNEKITMGIELSLFQEILESIVPKLDKTKFTFFKLVDFLPAIFYGSNFQVFKSIENNSSPKIGIKEKTHLYGYVPIPNIRMPEVHSIQGYMNLLSINSINIPFDYRYKELIELLKKQTIIKQTRTEIQIKFGEIGYDTKQTINIFTSLKNINILIEIGQDENDNKVFSKNLELVDNIANHIFNTLKVKIENTINEKIDENVLTNLILQK